MKKLPYLIPIICFSFILLIPIFAGFCFGKNLQQPLSKQPGYTKNLTIRFLDTSTGSTHSCPLEEYLVGVLAAEMPAGYHSEALKAQAVAARSYIIYKLNSNEKSHQNADICTDPNHCKGYLDEKTAKSRWKKETANEYWQKLTDAVDLTKGEYMIYDDEVIEAFFFARSGGKTENSEDVWSSPRPYLRSVASEADKNHPDFLSSLEIPNQAAREKLKSKHNNIKIDSSKIQIGKVTLTEGGNVKSIELEGKLFKGTEIRTMFSLKSADFDVLSTDSSLKFTVRGYGHGVGMSQFGANEMALSGENYTEILSHYYTNIQIIKP